MQPDEPRSEVPGGSGGPNGRSAATKPATFAAEMLRAGARVFASEAAERLLETHPDAASLFGSKAFRGWHDHLTQRIGELAASLEVGSAERFRRDVAWSIAAFGAREIPADPVVQSMRILREIILEGLPSEAAQAAAEVLDTSLEAGSASARPLRRLDADGPLGDLPIRYLHAALEGNRREAIRMLTAAADGGASVASLYEQVLLAVEAEIGTMWHLGEISVPEEHVASETARSAMAVLCHASPPAEPRGLTVLVGAIEGDRHDIGLRAVADLAELAGYRAVSLGADVPVRDLARAAAEFEADVVILSATMTVHLPAMRSAIAAIRAADPGGSLRVLVGGEAFAHEPALAERLGADGYAASPSDAVRLIG